MTYNPEAIASHFDALGSREWDRFGNTLGDRVSLALHSRALERFTPRGSRVLEVGAGPGRFTEQLHQLGCRIVVGDISARQLELNEETARSRGFTDSIEARHQLDICDLGQFPDATFDAVIAFGGLFSYVFERRDQALNECIRVLRPGGVLLLSVMSLWGTFHRHFAAVVVLSEWANRRIIGTGDLTKETDPASTHYCHMFRAAELRAFLDRDNLETLLLSASSAVSTGLDLAALSNEERWPFLLEVESEACIEPGFLDAGTHMIAVVRRAA